MQEFTGKNPSFKVIWSFNEQCYRVYKNGKLVIKKFRFEDVISYLN
jgi:hypothetical protein